MRIDPQAQNSVRIENIAPDEVANAAANVVTNGVPNCARESNSTDGESIGLIKAW